MLLDPLKIPCAGAIIISLLEGLYLSL